DNIIINSQDQAILIDFGSAREFLAGFTNKMTAMLTPGYAPIEQYANFNKPNASTDLYAICASIYKYCHLTHPSRLTQLMGVHYENRVMG
ncbi:MAG: hypothetical protein F6K22_25490, partial [Okeania sp. SIO2F4]|nr:hypothetical protein [Okeania sp. SIO2F4]